MANNLKKILFVDTVHPILEERLIGLGYVCEHDLKASKEEIKSICNAIVAFLFYVFIFS